MSDALAGRPGQVILRNALLLMGTSVVAQVMSLLSGMLLTRHLLASGYGNYAFSYVFAWFVLLAMNLGIKGVLLRDLPRHPEWAGAYLVQLILLRSLIAGFALIISLAVGSLLEKPDEVRTIMALFMLISITDSISLAFVDVFRGLEDMGFEARVYSLEKTLSVVGIAIAVYWQWSVVAIVQIMYSLALCRMLAWLVPARRRMVLPAVRLDWALWRYLVTEGWQYLKVDLASAVVQRVDVLLLGILATAASVGRYNAAYTVYLVAAVLPQMITSALQPTSARLSHQSPSELVPLQVRIARLTVLLSMPVVITFGAAAPLIMRLLFGVSFEEAGNILRWLTLALPSLVVTGFVANHFFATDRQDLNFRVVAGNAVLNLALNLLLIPRWGAYGAVTATVVSEIGAMVCLLILARRSIAPALLRAIAPIWATGMVSYAVAVWIAERHVWLSAPLGLLVYVVAIVRLRLGPDWRALIRFRFDRARQDPT